MPAKPPHETLVLVTGASGFIASQVVSHLLSRGFRVRGTVRSLANRRKVDPVRALDVGGRLELVEADLLVPEHWIPAVSGCDFVQHIASPFPIIADEKCISTAVDGTLNVFRAVAQCPSVQKVVLTSSCAAVNEGHPQNQLFTEEFWTNVESKSVGAYAKSKTLAERAAWEFHSSLGASASFRLTVLNPVFVVGPVLIDEQGASISVIRQFLHHELPALPPMQLALVDVRDVAVAHVEAMLRREADGERILLTAQPSFWFSDISAVLRKEFSNQGYWIPRIRVPAFFVWLFSFCDKQAASILDRVGFQLRFDNSKAKRLLGMEFANPSKALLAMAHSLIQRGIVRRTRGYSGCPEEYSNNNFK